MTKSRPVSHAQKRHIDTLSHSTSNNSSLCAAWFVTLLLMSTTLGLVGFLVYQELDSTPYIDEIFHLRQTRQYCLHGNWTHWDSKITTFPGLYILTTLFSRGIALPAEYLTSLTQQWSSSSIDLQHIQSTLQKATQSVLNGESDILKFLCLYPVHRFVINPLCAICSIYAVHKIFSRNSPNSSFTNHLLKLLVIFAFPLSFFFNFLFYTESGSILFILLTMLAMESGRVRLSALPAAAAILFRQTNVVWIAFIAVDHLLARIYGPSTAPQPVHRRPINLDTEQVESDLLVDDALQIVTSTIPQVLSFSIRNLFSLIGQFFLHAALVAGFAYFVHWNGGITVGDREAHKPVLHLPQVLYFIAFCGFFAAPTLLFAQGLFPRPLFSFISNLRYCLINPFKQGSLVALAAALTYYAVDKFTTAHPYLLADNRHYTFYIWQRSFARYEWFKFAMIPIYMACFGLLSQQLQKALKNRLPNSTHAARSLWILAFFGLTAATLVPSPLLEFRYFIIPFILLLLLLIGHGNPSNFALFTQLLAFVVINAVTIHLFLHKPFKWPNAEEPIARFMW